MKDKTCLVIGGLGAIGPVVVEQFVENKFQVRASLCKQLNFGHTFGHALGVGSDQGVSDYCLILPNSSGEVRVQHIPKSEMILKNIIDAQKLALSGEIK